MKKIMIIGAGWLGRPLAHYLQTLGHFVVVTKTTADGANLLTSEGLQAEVLDLTHNANQLRTLIEQYDIELVIGCFPPGFRKGLDKQYANNWQHIVESTQSTSVRKLVMVSSTTVYPNLAQPMIETDATYALALSDPLFSENAHQMLIAEQHVIDSHLDYGIVRCSGLIGPDRHPARFVSKLKQVSLSAPANMIHQSDAIGAICFVAMLESNQVVNATTPNTVAKSEFYRAAIERSGESLTLPPIVDSPDKRIISDKLSDLGYRFHFQHTLELI